MVCWRNVDLGSPKIRNVTMNGEFFDLIKIIMYSEFYFRKHILLKFTKIKY